MYLLTKVLMLTSFLLQVTIKLINPHNPTSTVDYYDLEMKTRSTSMCRKMDGQRNSKVTEQQTPAPAQDPERAISGHLTADYCVARASQDKQSMYQYALIYCWMSNQHFQGSKI